jgi:hypothetical protein
MKLEQVVSLVTEPEDSRLSLADGCIPFKCIRSSPALTLVAKFLFKYLAP